MWVWLWLLDAKGESWGWSTTASRSILCQTRASGVDFGTLCMKMTPARAKNVDFLCLSLIWCLFCIGWSWSWSLHETFLNSACTPMIINWLPRLLYACPDEREGQGGDMTYWSLLVAEHKKSSDLLFSYVNRCHEIIKMWRFPTDIYFKHAFYQQIYEYPHS